MPETPSKFLLTSANGRFWRVQFIYLVVSSLGVILLLLLPRNQDWLQEKVSWFYKQKATLGLKNDLATRREKGYGDAFVYINLIRERCQPDDYFLIPPQAYLIRNAYQQGKSTGYNWVYPSVLYYHLGKSVHLLDMNSPDSQLQRATHTFWVFEKKIFLLTFKPYNRPLVMGEFRKYDPHFFAYTPEQARAFYRKKP